MNALMGIFLWLVLLGNCAIFAKTQVDFQMGSQSIDSRQDTHVSFFQSGAPQGMLYQEGTSYYSAGLILDFNIDNEPYQREKKLLTQKPYIADSSITTTKIVDQNVTTAKLADTAVTTAKILDANVTSAKLADSSVAAQKLNDDVVGTGVS